ncbi:MMPL family transporter [Rhodococcus tibetensis]|uniref:MMPL family transporter n=1 Tax=Rhodococcus tibetensis TaxID=2965064 RepID=A0ABT1Q9I1_9NOCA|nr:MMPL family transporter [Rhodococcus sp. FXJ9.536]MCQ4118929.1 MMPL family transporter [Rhodococcus sp. FXJ9.536]
MKRTFDLIVRSRWGVVMVWLGVCGISAIFALTSNNYLSGGGWYVEGSDSRIAAQTLSDGFEGRGPSSFALVVTSESMEVSDPDFRRSVQSVFDVVAADLGIESVDRFGWSTLPDGFGGQFVGTDRQTVVDFVGTSLDDGSARREFPRLQAMLTERFDGSGIQATMVSASSFWGEMNELSESGLIRSELIALPVLALVLLYVFRSVPAALLSGVVGGASVLLSVGALGFMARFTEISLFGKSAATMLGLAIGVDYSLFIISRYREELAAGLTPVAALRIAWLRSGETVAVSGFTIVVASTALFIVQLDVIKSMAIGAMLGIGSAMVISLIVLPPLILIFSRFISPSATTESKSRKRTSIWERGPRFAMKRPYVTVGICLCICGLLALPALDMKTVTPDSGILPQSSSMAAGYESMRTQFGEGSVAPINVVATFDEPLVELQNVEAIDRFVESVSEVPGVTAVNSVLPTLATLGRGNAIDGLRNIDRDGGDPRAAAVNRYIARDGKALVVEALVDGDASSAIARDAVRQIRELGTHETAFTINVGGETAEGMDANAEIERKLWIVLALMLVGIFALLFVFFRSVFIPLKAVVVNVLSISATYGVVVLVFQHGLGRPLFGAESVGSLTNFVPIVLAVLLFGISTDYEVFLISRIREAYRSNGGNTKAAVVEGSVKTAPLISGAALLMIAVFMAFTLASVLPMKQLGLGLAAAVALDATLIRLLAIPAAMSLMGRLNWWTPIFPDKTVLHAPPEIADEPRHAHSAL